MRRRLGACWRSHWFWMGWTERRRYEAAEWTARHCETRCLAAHACMREKVVHRYNEEGIEGLSDRRRSGCPGMLNAGQKAELSEMARAGPDPATDGVVRWRRIDLAARIGERFGIVTHEHTVGKHLAAPGFRRLPVRQQHPKSDPKAQETFKNMSPA